MVEVPPRHRPSLIVFADDWGRHPSSCQHLVRHLLDRYEVYWVNTIGTRKPRFDWATLSRASAKLRQWLRPGKGPERLPANLHVLNPRMWPWFRYRFDRLLNRRLLMRQLSPLVESLPWPRLAVTTLPIVADLVDRLPVQRWIYYCVDDFGQWPGLDQQTLRHMESHLLDRIDTVVAVSETLKDKLERTGRVVPLLTHGVDLDFWVAKDEGRTIPELAGIQRPLIVFWGVVDARMDVRFVQQLATDLRQGTIVLAGPVGDCDPVIHKTARVVGTGSLSYELLPHLARAAAVLIMPYADLAVTRAMQPLKLKEYLATGKPAVVRDLPANRAWADCLDLARTPESFSRAVHLRLATGLPEHQRTARARLAGENWAEKACQFERLALDLEASAVARGSLDREGNGEAKATVFRAARCS